MARVVRKRKPDPKPLSPLAALMEKHLEALQIQNYSQYTVRNRRVHIGFFVQLVSRSRDNGACGSDTAYPGALPAIPVSLPAEEREASDIQKSAYTHRAVAGVVPVDGAAAAYPAQSCIGTGTAANGATLAEIGSNGRRDGASTGTTRYPGSAWIA